MSGLKEKLKSLTLVGKLKNKPRFSLTMLIFFALVFVGTGAYIVYRSLAAEVIPEKRFTENFDTNKSIAQTTDATRSTDANWWVTSGGLFNFNGGTGKTIQGSLKSTNTWYKYYRAKNPTDTQNGTRPQNVFRAFTRSKWKDATYKVYTKMNAYNLSTSTNRNSENGIGMFIRYVDKSNYYSYTLNVDGNVVLTKRLAGLNYTLAKNSVFSGTYNRSSAPILIPKGYWYGLKAVVQNQTDGSVKIQLYFDENGGNWKLITEVVDNGNYGKQITAAGFSGLKSDFMDAEYDGLEIVSPQTIVTPPIQIPIVTPIEKPSPTPVIERLNVLDYGAKINDSLDDTAAFNSAIKAAVSASKELLVPAGTYNVKNVSVPSSAVLYIDPNATLVNTGVRGGYVFVLNGTNVKIYGAGTINANQNGGGIDVNGSAMSINDITVLNSYGYVGSSDNYNAINVVGKNITLSNLKVRDSWEGIVIANYSSAVTVKNSYFNGFKREGILAYGYSSDIHIEDNTIENYGLGDIFRGGIHFYGTRNVYAQRNTIRNAGKDCSGIRLRDTNGFVVEYNNITNVGETGIGLVQQNDWPGITVGNGTIANNTIDGSGLRGIGHPYPSAESIIVKNNTVRNVYYNSAKSQTLDSADCIIVLASGSQVLNNTVQNCGGYGVRVGSGVTSTGNTVTNAK